MSIGHADGRGSAGGPMSEVVDNSLRYLSAPDIKAIMTYLKSVPANGDGTDIAAAPTPAAPREVSEQPAPPNQSGPGLRVFEGACIGCHQFNGKGAVANFAALVGSRTANDPAGPTPPRSYSAGPIFASPKLLDLCPTSVTATRTPKSLRS